jgi:hypothetical protein
MFLPMSTIKIVVLNILAFMPWYRWIHKKEYSASNERVKNKFKEEINKTDYLNPLLDMCNELWYELWNLMFKSIVTTKKTKEFWFYMFWKWKTILYSPWDNIVLKWKIKSIISYYDDIVNYLFITWQLKWYLETYKTEIEKILYEKLYQKKDWRMKQKQLHDYLETLGADGENDEYIKSQTNEENKNHLMSSDVLKVTTDVWLPSKLNTIKIKKSAKKQLKKQY